MPSRQRALCSEPGCKNFAITGGKCSEHYVPIKREYKHERRTQYDYRKWYSDDRWKKARAIQLRKQPLCEDCIENGDVTPATTVDHIIPHRGNWNLFIDSENHRSLCKSCHDRKTAREDGGFGNRRK